MALGNPQINPGNYPVSEALEAIDHFTLLQEGEPHVFTFGTSIRHFAGITVGERDIEVEGQDITVSDRKSILVSTYGTLGEMAADLREKTDTDSELLDQRAVMLTDQGVLHDTPIETPERLPRTTAEEKEAEEFEPNLSIDAIKDAAQYRAERGTDNIPGVTVINAVSGERRTIKLDASALIARGDLGLTQSKTSQHRTSNTGDVTVHTYLEVGSMFKQMAADLGLDPENMAMVVEVEGGHERLYALDAFFESQPSVANDFWSESGDYSDADDKAGLGTAAPRHSLYDRGNYRRVDSYDVDDFLDTVQEALEDQLRFILEESKNKLVYTPINALDSSFYELRRRVQEAGFDLGYSFLSTLFFTPAFMAVGENGQVERALSIDIREKAVSAENSLRELKFWQAEK